jgi:hypothetical protein
MRRKGEISAAAIDRRWPHQSALADDGRDAQTFAAILAFCDESGAAPRRHSVVIADAWHTIFCFATAADAALFRDRFGGQPFDPAWRGKGANWAVPASPAARRAKT